MNALFVRPFASVTLLAASLLATPVSAQSLVGEWNSSSGRRYDVAAVGGRYFFRLDGVTQARGYMAGNTVELQRKQGDRWIPWNGQVVSYMNGQPYQIRMDDGFLFRRWGVAAGAVSPPPGGTVSPNPFSQPNPYNVPLPLPQPNPQPQPQPAPEPTDSVAGTYVSNPLSLTYRVSQAGNSFSWTIDGLAQRGQGTINGDRVQASWQGPLVRGASGGTLRIGANGVEAIDFDNGFVLTLQ